MPKLGIAVDEQAYRLLKKYGGHRNIGALIGRLVRQHDKDEKLSLSAIHDQLDHLIQLFEERKEDNVRK
jgi:hypothetical protein